MTSAKNIRWYSKYIYFFYFLSYLVWVASFMSVLNPKESRGWRECNLSSKCVGGNRIKVVIASLNYFGFFCCNRIFFWQTINYNLILFLFMLLTGELQFLKPSNARAVDTRFSTS